MIKVKGKYQVKKDLEFLLENNSTLKLSNKLKISRNSLEEILRTNEASIDILEKIYSSIYLDNYRLNQVKEEILKETNELILFHGSKEGLKEIKIDGSRLNCDFGYGFYLGESYEQALNFIVQYPKSSIYSFKIDIKDLKVKRFQCDLEWMLAIAYYRGKNEEIKNNNKILKIIKEIEDADIIIAPIADNKMFNILSEFSLGEINMDVAIHSLSAYGLGNQYIIKTEKALNKLEFIENYYVSIPERQNASKKSLERAYQIDTKLKLAKMEYKTGLYIGEILNEKI